MYRLAKDADGHLYVIPVAREFEFNKWAESDDAADSEVPDYAVQVGGSMALVSFPSYKIR